MHILIGLAAGAALLYVWLIGWWFGRVLMFLLLAVSFGLLGAWAGANILLEQPHPVATVYDKGPSISQGKSSILDAYDTGSDTPPPAPPSIPSPAVEIIGVLIGLALAWPISSIPIYWHRRQPRRFSY